VALNLLDISLCKLRRKKHNYSILLNHVTLRAQTKSATKIWFRAISKLRTEQQARCCSVDEQKVYRGECSSNSLLDIIPDHLIGEAQREYSQGDSSTSKRINIRLEIRNSVQRFTRYLRKTQAKASERERLFASCTTPLLNKANQNVAQLLGELDAILEQTNSAIAAAAAADTTNDDPYHCITTQELLAIIAPAADIRDDARSHHLGRTQHFCTLEIIHAMAVWVLFEALQSELTAPCIIYSYEHGVERKVQPVTIMRESVVRRHTLVGASGHSPAPTYRAKDSRVVSQPPPRAPPLPSAQPRAWIASRGKSTDSKRTPRRTIGSYNKSHSSSQLQHSRQASDSEPLRSLSTTSIEFSLDGASVNADQDEHDSGSESPMRETITSAISNAISDSISQPSVFDFDTDTTDAALQAELDSLTAANTSATTTTTTTSDALQSDSSSRLSPPPTTTTTTQEGQTAANSEDLLRMMELELEQELQSLLVSKST
jgi:hypothetical protein